MKRYGWLMMVLLLTMASGCDAITMLRAKKVYVGPGQYAEIAKPVKVPVWITNGDTGKKEWRIVEAQAGWLIGRQKGSPDSVASGDR